MANAARIDEEEALGRAYDVPLMRRLLRYLRPYVTHVALTLLLLLLASATAIIGPWITQIVIDEAIPTRDTKLLGLLIAVYVGTVALGSGLQYAQAILTTWLGQSVIYDIRSEIFEKFQRLDLKFYDKNPVGRLMTRITNDVETLSVRTPFMNDSLRRRLGPPITMRSPSTVAACRFETSSCDSTRRVAVIRSP